MVVAKKTQAGGKKIISKRPVRELDEDEEAPVIVFDQTKFGIRERKGTDTRRRPHHADPSPSTATLADAKTIEDADDIADMEVGQIWEQLKTSMEDLHASTLRGKERKKYQVEKAIKLGARPPRKQQHPKDIRIGMALKAKEREKQEKERAREMELVLAKGKSGTASKRARSKKGGNRK